jgi:nucleotide-binding universal stress UspA family protein
MFDTILVAVDGSKPAEKAVELAARIAKADGDAIVVVHVTESLPYREVQPPPEGHPEDDRGAIQLAERYAKDLEAAGLRAVSTFATPCTAPRPASSWTPPTSTGPA